LRQGQVLSFIVHRPTVDEKGYRMTRAETGGQVIGYALNPYAADQPAGKRYGRNGG
jgi:ribulose bisphosphate carboxylase small subunit